MDPEVTRRPGSEVEGKSGRTVGLELANGLAPDGGARGLSGLC